MKEKYNKWLFNKYGCNRGLLFQKIPLIYRLCPLFSPSIYGKYEGEYFIKDFTQGMKISFEEFEKAGKVLAEATRKSMELDKD